MKWKGYGKHSLDTWSENANAVFNKVVPWLIPLENTVFNKKSCILANYTRSNVLHPIPLPSSFQSQPCIGVTPRVVRRSEDTTRSDRAKKNKITKKYSPKDPHVISTCDPQFRGTVVIADRTMIG